MTASVFRNEAMRDYLLQFYLGRQFAIAYEKGYPAGLRSKSRPSHHHEVDGGSRNFYTTAAVVTYVNH